MKEWRIMRDHNDLPRGFQISATSHCCNEKCCNWLWKWASQTRAGLLCTWRLPAANRSKSLVSFTKCWVENLENFSHEGFLTDPHPHNLNTCTFTAQKCTAGNLYSNCLWLAIMNGAWWYGIFDTNTDFREQENSDIHNIANIIYIYMISPECGYQILLKKDVQWKQDILHFNRLYPKHQCTEQWTLYLLVIK